VKNELGLRNAGVFIQEKVWLENSLSQSEGGWQGRGWSGWTRPYPVRTTYQYHL